MGTKNPTPKTGPDLCADCQHERSYHNAAGCGIEQCGCVEFTREQASTADINRTREVAAAFREGYRAGYDRGESGEVEDGEDAWDRSRASEGLLRALVATTGSSAPSLPDDVLRRFWQSVQGPQAQLTGPLIRFAALVYREAEGK